MVRKFIFALALSFLVGVQVLSASCDVRCTSMSAMTHSHTSRADAPAPHCHHLSVRSGKEATLTANEPCGTTLCRADLKAITKHANRNNTDPGKLLLATIALPIDPLQSATPSRTPAIALVSRDGTPLAQRPASLRI